MTINRNKLKELLLKNFIEEFEEKSLEVWVEVALEYDVEYEIVEFMGRKQVKAKHPESAMAKNYGSAALNVPAEFWFEKAKREWERRMEAILNE